MSQQYPGPYSPPSFPQQPGYYAPYSGDPLTRARRASWLMIGIGLIISLMGTCLTGISFGINRMPLPPDQERNIQHWESLTNMPRSTLFLTMGVGMLIPGIIMIVLGLFVRRGGRGSIVTSIVFTIIVILRLLYETLAALLGGTENAGSGLCVGVVGLGLFGWLLSMLIAALKARSNLAAMQQQYMAQYWHYQQSMQGYPPPAQELKEDQK